MSGERYRLRLARVEEIGRLRAIEQTAAQRFRQTDFAWVADAAPGSTETFATSIAAGQTLVMEPLAGVDSGQPVAFCAFAAVDGGAYIEEIDVLPDHAGHRLAAQLINAVEPWARSQRLPILTLSTFSTIPWNAPYYRRLGFRDMGHLGPGLAAIRERHRGLGLSDEQRVFLWRPLAR
ncbi:MAG TPA: GNAT family N-acetyltransferase [Terriglobales bacterium]|nr:GNAT family N-acetyltransferase [Terriglobales bacterium]